MLSQTSTGIERRRSSSIQPPVRQAFPDAPLDLPDHYRDETDDDDYATRDSDPAPLLRGLPQGLHSSERWPHRKESRTRSFVTWATNVTFGKSRQQKSLTEAIETVRKRRASFSESAHEIADSLKAPISLKLVLLCAFWYSTSILTNTSSKAILTAFPKPVTLTVIQFSLVTFWCVFLSWLAKYSPFLRDAMPVLKNGIRRPSKDIIMATLPLTGFQIGGHILSSDAMARISVSLVHTIKGLSPLMTVVAYRVFFNIKYSLPTYLSLIPLTVGVIMACSANVSGNFIGLIYAFGSAILFVTQNIVSKQIFTDAAKAEADGAPISRRKPDKLNLLCYSSALAFLFTCPIWLWSEGFSIAADFLHDGTIDLREKPGSLDHGRLAAEFIFNGTFHFGQSLVAFVLLGMVSPVTYSVASLIKRVSVIIFAIMWFGSPMTTIQGFGFAMTFAGLYLYDRTSDAAKVDRRARAKAENKDTLLPISKSDSKKHDGVNGILVPSHHHDSSKRLVNGTPAYANGDVGLSVGPGRPRGTSASTSPSGLGSLAPGTKAADTWTQNDVAMLHKTDHVR